MMAKDLDIRKTEAQNQESQVTGPYKFFSKINSFLCVEFFCNFIMAIQLDVLLGVFLAIQNAKFDSPLRIFDFALAMIILGSYITYLYFIMNMTYQIMKSDKDTLLKTHYKTKFKNWLFIVEPLVEMKNDTEKNDSGETTKDMNESQLGLKSATQKTPNLKKKKK